MYEFVKTLTGWRVCWGPVPVEETSTLPFPPTPAGQQPRLRLLRRDARHDGTQPVTAGAVADGLHLACRA